MSSLPTTIIDGRTYATLAGTQWCLDILADSPGARRIARTFRVDPLRAAELYLRASHLCEACGGLPEPQPRLCIDHDHATARVRGAICGRCNTMLGIARDSAEHLRKLADYLDQTRSAS